MPLPFPLDDLPATAMADEETRCWLIDEQFAYSLSAKCVVGVLCKEIKVHPVKGLHLRLILLIHLRRDVAIPYRTYVVGELL